MYGYRLPLWHRHTAQKLAPLPFVDITTACRALTQIAIAETYVADNNLARRFPSNMNAICDARH